LLFCNIDILDEQFNLQKNRFVGVAGGRIDYVGAVKPEKRYEREYDGAGRLLMPGLYNSHTHSPMSLLRGYAENMPLADWLNKRVFPFEAKLEAEDIYNGCLLSIAEMLRFGTVSFTDMYYMGEEVAKAVIESGIKANYSNGVSCFDGSDYRDLPVYENNKRLIKNFHNAADGRFKVDLCIHGEYTSTPKVVAGVAEHAASEGLNTHVHISETKAEHEACKTRHGKTPVEYFRDLGLLDAPATAAHCVWLENDDFDILREKGVTVASCPVSNMKLASGFADVPRMLRKSVRVAIGTDSSASNNNLDMLKEIHAFCVASKGAFRDPEAVSPAQALEAATARGAAAQGRADCGVLKAGAKADLIVLDARAPHMHPAHNMANNVAYAASGGDVLLTMADGRVLYREGEWLTIDIEKAVFNAGESTAAVLKKLNGF